MVPAAVVLATLGPVFAADYNPWFYGPGCCCSFLIIGIFLWFLKKFIGEFERGRKQGLSDEEIIDG